LDTSGFGCSSSRSRVKGCWQAADRHPTCSRLLSWKPKTLNLKTNTHVPAHFDFNQDLCSTSAEKVVIFLAQCRLLRWPTCLNPGYVTRCVPQIIQPPSSSKCTFRTFAMRPGIGNNKKWQIFTVAVAKMSSPTTPSPFTNGFHQTKKTEIT